MWEMRQLMKLCLYDIKVKIFLNNGPKNKLPRSKSTCCIAK